MTAPVLRFNEVFDDTMDELLATLTTEGRDEAIDQAVGHLSASVAFLRAALGPKGARAVFEDTAGLADELPPPPSLPRPTALN